MTNHLQPSQICGRMGLPMLIGVALLLASPQAAAATVTLTLYLHDSSTTGPVLVGALVTGQDAAGATFSQTTNSSGYVTITGTAGTWSFTSSKSGYQTSSWSQPITVTQTRQAYLFRDDATLASATFTPPGTSSPVVLAPGTIFRMDWVFNNTGTSTWTRGGTGYTLNTTTYPGGAVFGAHYTSVWLQNSADVPPGGQGQFACVTNVVAPTTPGWYYEYWQLSTAAPTGVGTSFGPVVTMSLHVVGNGTVTLGNLTQTYDGTPRNATATTNPSGLPVTLTYNGSTTAPTNAGSYNVVGTIDSGQDYQGSSSGTMTINKATATVTLGNLTQTYDGTPKSATATTNPSGLAVTLTYDGSSTAPTNAGTYNVVGTINDSNYQGSNSGTLTINPPPGTVATPTFSPAAGTYSSAQSVTISCATSGATIHYTTDGSTPTASSTVYGGAVNVANSMTLKAFATKSGMTDSGVGSAAYTITAPPATVETPTFSPAPGTYSSAQSVTISCATSGATIHYTTDGSTPTASSTVYGGAVNVANSMTLKAFATKSGMTDSGVGSAAYTITAPPAGSVQLSATAYSVNENGGTVTITATRTGGSSGAASVNYATADSTATAGTDYTTKSGTLNWSDGDAASKTFAVTILEDAVYEGDETFTVNLSGATGASLGTPASATVTIVDNETPVTTPTVTVTSPNGGETWGLGVAHTITWSVAGDTSQINNFLISYSLDGGTTYQNDVGTALATDRSISWTPPPVISPTAVGRIRVEARNASNSVLSEGFSNGTFTFGESPGTSYAITASAGPNGTVSPSGTFEMNAGDNQTFTASPAAGYTVNQWLVNNTPVQGGGNSYTLADISTNVTVSVRFYSGAAAVEYAKEYAYFVCSDGFFWETGWPPTALAPKTDVPKGGVDCAHFVSCCIGEPAGGLIVPNRTGTNAYGEPSAPKLVDWLLNSEYGIAEKKDAISDLFPGDVIAYCDHSNPPKVLHVALYLGDDNVACHSGSFLDNRSYLTVKNADPNNTMFIHILGNSTVAGPAPLASSPTGFIGRTVTFSPAGSDSSGSSVTYTWDFGDGTTSNDENASHVYQAPGVYSVTLTISDGTTTTTQQMYYVVSAAEAPVGDDNGGDEHWDSHEPDVFSITKGSVRFKFPSSSKDRLTLSGTLPVTKFLKPAGKKITVLIGGFRKDFTLNAKGRAIAGASRFQLKGKMRGGVFKATPAKFALTIQRAPLLAALQEFGFADKTTAQGGEQAHLATIIMVDVMGYHASKTVLYKAKAGKSGSAK